MIIKSKPLSPFFFRFAAWVTNTFLRRHFKKIQINQIDIRAGHSYFLLCNHFSFLDGFLAFYLANKLFFKPRKMKHLYIMSVRKQMEKKWWLRYIGSFSIEPGKRSIEESFAYAAAVLSEPGNVLLFYPQAKLESQHIRHIHFEDGINQIVPKIKGNCQLIWSSNLIEYFEGVKPSLHFNVLDCGTIVDYNFEMLQQRINAHHLEAITRNFRFTKEPV